VSDEKEFDLSHDHGDAHEHQHHEQEGFGPLDWIKHLFGDLEHSDLGEKHFEQFIHPQNQLASDLAVKVILSPFAFLAKFEICPTHRIIQQKKSPIWKRSFAGLPFFKHIPNRGPPLFS
jgi:hypothetical protein